MIATSADSAMAASQYWASGRFSQDSLASGALMCPCAVASPCGYHGRALPSKLAGTQTVERKPGISAIIGDMMAGAVHVVDDDPAVRDSLRLLLESAGFAVA